MKSKWFFILVIILLLVMINLGFWQLRRYHEKQQLLAEYDRHIEAPTLVWQDFLLKKQNFRRVKLTGHYLKNKTLLLDNRWHNNQLGYEVLTPFKIDNQEKYLLVNRGWVAAPRSRQQQPNIKSLPSQQHLSGYVLKPAKPGFMLGENIEADKQWPLRIQQIKLSDIADVTQLNFYPYVLRLLPTDGNELIQDWRLVNITPARHLGYAIQWFLMSLTLIIVYLIFRCKNNAR